MSLPTPPFMDAIEKKDANAVRNFLQKGDIPPDQIITGFRRAAEIGATGVVQEFLRSRRIDPSSFSNIALILAIERGHSDVVRVLIADRRMDLVEVHGLLVQALQSPGTRDERKNQLSTLLEELRASR